MVEYTVVYEGGFRCESTHGPSGSKIPTDAPVDNMGKGEAFSPTDLTASSLASCMLTTMAIISEKRSLPINLQGAKARVVKSMSPTLPRRIAKIEVELEIPAPPDHPSRAEVEKIAHQCPVALSLHPDIEQAITFRWVG